VKSFKIDQIAQQEFDEAAAWYEHQEIGLGFEYIEEVDRVLVRSDCDVETSLCLLGSIEAQRLVTRGLRGPRRTGANSAAEAA
jgi:hypothetical protein